MPSDVLDAASVARALRDIALYLQLQGENAFKVRAYDLAADRVLGVGEKFFPVPWSMLDYSKDKGGYVIPLAQDVISKAPTYRLEDLTKDDGASGKMRESSYSYFNVKPDWN